MEKDGTIEKLKDGKDWINASVVVVCVLVEGKKYKNIRSDIQLKMIFT